MIISERWLKEWIPLKQDAKHIADRLTGAGLEVDAVESVGGQIDNLIVGQVEEVTKHPDADRLNLTKVNVGESELLSIVCGASNVREGLKVVVAKIGAKLPNGLKIKKAKVRGVESFGMLCSAAELGLAESSDGLLELDDDATLGQRVDAYLGLDDTLIDIDLTPNRGDCLSIQGIAREMHVLEGGDYSEVAIEEITPSSIAAPEVELADNVSCPRYAACQINNVQVNARSPLWLQERLRRCGIRPISAIVDITNYVMLELGQPMHAFDADKIEQKIIVRQSQKGEFLTLLDDSKVELDGDTLVIADASRALAIAGVMGGLDSAIGDQTTSIILESAHFTRAAIAGRARRYGLHTESSHRFERGVDPQLSAKALKRAMQLVVQICGGDASQINDQNYIEDGESKAVELRYERLKTLLGMELSREEVGDILARIAPQVQETSDGWSVISPSYRFDIERECDLVEEVARVKGYDNVPVKLPLIAPRNTVASEKQLDVLRIKRLLVDRDYQEVVTYSFIDKNDQALFDNSEAIHLLNPLAENMSVMRTGLLAGLMQALVFNLNRQRERIRLFEVGAVYHKHNGEIQEKAKIGGVVTGSKVSPQWGQPGADSVDFYDVKGDLENLLGLTASKEPFIFREFEHIALHPGQLAKIYRGEREIGWLGRLHPKIEKKYGVTQPVYAFELDLRSIREAEVADYQGISRFPSVKRDLSVVVDESVRVADLVDSLADALGPVCKDIVLFDVYEGDNIPAGKKSVSLSLHMQVDDRTLTDEDTEKYIGVALDFLGREFDAALRG